MKFNGKDLTINIGDSVSFYETCDSSKFDNFGYIDIKNLVDHIYITGKVIAVLGSNHLELLVKAEFSHHTVAACDIHQVNNLCVGLHGFMDKLAISIVI